MIHQVSSQKHHHVLEAPFQHLQSRISPSSLPCSVSSAHAPGHGGGVITCPRAAPPSYSEVTTAAKYPPGAAAIASNTSRYDREPPGTVTLPAYSQMPAVAYVYPPS